MLNANNIKFRCSSLGHIMTEPKEISPMETYLRKKEQVEKWKSDYAAMKNKETKTALKTALQIAEGAKVLPYLEANKDGVHISESCITHLVDVYVSNKYNRFTEIKGKQLDKGNETEEDSITIVSRITKTVFHKNEQYLENEYIKGTPDLFKGVDIRKSEVVRDTKSSWDIFTFNRAKAKKLNPMYKWQGTGYMDLTGASECYIDYCLNNTPYRLINKELYHEGFNHDEQNTPAWIELQIIANHVYDRETFDKYIAFRGVPVIDEYAKAVYAGFVEVPLEERHHYFRFDRNHEDIEDLHKRVIDCRDWMNEFLFKTKVLTETLITK